MHRKREPLQNLRNSPGRTSRYLIAVLLFKLTCSSVAQGDITASEERHVPAGSYVPFFALKTLVGTPKTDLLRKPTVVSSFWLDTHPVTNREYLKFLKSDPEWRRSAIARVFADDSYLKHWKSDLSLRSPRDSDQPVTHVSWFSASAYCHAQGKELPTTDQWEYAAEDSGKNSEQIRNRILTWYSAPNAKILGRVKQQPANGYGIYDLHGLLWEWTLDFNSAMIGSELRSDGTKDDNLFCGAGSLSASDASDYAKFMRYSFRSSLRADYTTANLGFRCAREEKK